MSIRGVQLTALLTATLLGLSCALCRETPSRTAPFVRIVNLDEVTSRGKFTEAKDAAGIKYICNDNDYREPNEAESFAFDFEAPAAATYYIWAYVWVYNDQADSLFVKVGTGRSTWVIEHPDKTIKPFIKGDWVDWVVWNHLGDKTHRTWFWWRVAGTTNPQMRPVHVPLGFKLPAGKHRIIMSGREASARVAQLLITDDTTYVPEGLGGKRRK